jgi:hypothetical protein
MDCSSCDRNNVLKAYCYFSSRQEYFYDMRGEVFSTETFASYAVEVDLSWRYSVTCTNSLLKPYWNILEPFLKEALRVYKDSESLQEVSNFDTTYFSLVLGTPKR